DEALSLPACRAAGRRGGSGQPMTVKSPRVEIEYCTQCRWLLRAGWTAQELLTTFQDEVGEVALIPGTGGVFEVRVDGATIWSRKGEGRFPELKELKQRLRDRVAPERELGQSDRKEEE
ncbi:MAG TPA: SelT/SelW/SelH family protein, partial [Dongiaceae bacterium]